MPAHSTDEERRLFRDGAPAELGEGLPSGAGAQVVAQSGEARSALMAFGPASPLGVGGPLGPLGPQGEMGPVGDNSWNPSRYISGGPGWEGMSDRLAESGGPRGPSGPLSERGPVGSDWFGPAVTPALQPGGSAAILGPSGPAGPLGMTGPLGPVGVHGHQRDKDGNYRDQSGAVVRHMDAAYSDHEKKVWDLYEMYTEKQAKAMPDNDTSFAVEGESKGSEDVDSYPFQVSHPQFVSVNVVPLNPTSLDNFDLIFYDAAGKVLARTQTGTDVAWMQVMCQPGAYKVAVRMNDSTTRTRHISGERGARYRLQVTGTQRMQF